MRKGHLGILTSVLGVLGFAMAGCGEDFESCDVHNNCATGGGGTGGGGTGGGANASGTGGVGNTGGDGGGCDTSKSPRDEACLVSDQYAIFVSVGGNDGGAGTMSEPVGSVKRALELASGNGPGRVIICNATYPEAVKIDSAADGVSLYGGFKCPGGADAWTLEDGKRPSFEPTAAGYALELTSLTMGVVIEDIEFKAQAGERPRRVEHRRVRQFGSKRHPAACEAGGTGRRGRRKRHDDAIHRFADSRGSRWQASQRQLGWSAL